MAAIGSDQSGEKPSTIGAVLIRQTSKPRNRLVTSPGGKAPAWVETIGAPKSTPLAWVQRTAASSPAAAVAAAIKAASTASALAAPTPKPRNAGVVADRPEGGQDRGHGDRGELEPGQRERQAAGQAAGPGQHPQPAEQRMIAPNRARAAEHRGQAAHPSASAAYGHDGRAGDQQQRLREAAEPLPLPPDQGLQPDALAPLGLDVADLDRPPLDHDVAGQTDVEGEEGARRCR